MANNGKDFFAKVKNGNTKETDFFMGAFAPFWHDYIVMTENAAKTASKGNVPTLVAQCSNDVNVTKLDFDALVNATKNIVGSESVWIPSCHHLLAVSPSTDVSKTVLDPILNWTFVLRYLAKNQINHLLTRIDSISLYLLYLATLLSLPHSIYDSILIRPGFKTLFFL